MEPICPPGPFAASPLPNQNPSATSICDGFRFTEGPVWIASQNAVFFSDFEHGSPATNFNGDIVRFTPGGACSTFIPDVGTNGLAISATGQLLAASHLTQTLTEFDLATKAPTVVIDEFMGKKFSSPNDLTLHSNGTIYFTDPAWEVGGRGEQLPRSAYYREPGGAIHVIEELDRPNGITLSPDEKHLYIALVGPTRVYDLDTDGVPSNGRTFVSSGSDGMAVDCAGNLYLTDGGVKVFDPTGAPIGTIQTPGGTTNAAFGGPDRKTLYITGGTQLYSIQLNIPGYPY